MTDYSWMQAGVGEHLDRLVEQMMADVPPQPPPKPFDLDALRRLAAEADLTRPKVDRMVIAPDVKDRLLAMTTRRQEIPGPDRLWGTPVLIDEDMPPGHWELRDGDRVERRGPAGCRCEFCQSGEGNYPSRCGVCDALVMVERGRVEEHGTETGSCAGSGEEAS
jgi:hypothetical protein